MVQSLHMRYPPRMGFFVIVLAISQSVWASGPKWDPVPPEVLADNKPHLDPEAAVEILNLQTEIDDTQRPYGHAQPHIHRRDILWQERIKIYDPGRATDFTRVTRFFFDDMDPAFFKYKLAVRLTLPDGTTRFFDERDMRQRNVAEEGRMSGIAGLLASKSDWGVKEQFLAVPGVVPGAVLDIWYLDSGVFSLDWYMDTYQQEGASIRDFRYTYKYAPERGVVHHTSILHPCGGQMTHDDKTGVVLFTAHDVPSVRREPCAPPKTYYSLTIIHTVESLKWGLDRRHISIPLPETVPLSIGPWVYYLTGRDFQDADKGYVSKRVKEKAGELTAGATDPGEKASRIYRYVQALFQRFRNRADLENRYTRYIESIDELINLDKIDSTIIRKEDFHYLFVALVRAAGMECHSVFHPDRTAFPFSIEMVSDEFLSHWTIAVKVGDSWVLCAPCTDVPLRFGSLPWEIEGVPALMAMQRQQNVLDVAPAAAETSEAATQATLDLNSEGGLDGSCVRTFTGHHAHAVRNRLREKGQEVWWREARWLFGLENSSSEVQLVKIEGLDKPDDPVRVSATVHWPSYAAVLKDRMVFPLAVWCEGRPPVLSESTRTTPVFFQFPCVETETITIHLPPGYRPAYLPEPISAHTENFAYSLAIKHDPTQGVLTVKRSSTNRVIKVPTANYDQARDWFQRVAVADQISIVLTRKQEGPSQ